MRFCEHSLQKMIQEKYQGQVYFGKIEEGAELLSRARPFAKILLLISLKTADKFERLEKLFPSATVVALNPSGGAEKLFAQPDDISLVVCYGEDYAVATARYFAAVRALPLAVVAYNLTAQAAVKDEVTVCLGGEAFTYPVSYPEFLFFDDSLADKDGFLTAYCNLLPMQATLLELEFTSLLLQTSYQKEWYEVAEYVLTNTLQFGYQRMDERAVYIASVLFTLCRQEGGIVGEGDTLTTTYRRIGVGALSGYYALEKLSKLYHVFFSLGQYRKYYVPPYHARNLQASRLYQASEEEIGKRQVLPSVESLSTYADVLETVRAHFLCKAGRLLRKLNEITDDLQGEINGKKTENKILNCGLKYLPEGNQSYGLTSLIRDFGLLDF